MLFLPVQCMDWSCTTIECSTRVKFIVVGDVDEIDAESQGDRWVDDGA